jgi:hypothetical protein
MKRRIRLTEGRLRDIITEAVMTVLNDGGAYIDNQAAAMHPYRGLTPEPGADQVSWNSASGTPSVVSYNSNETAGGTGNLPNITVTAYGNQNVRRPQVPGMQQLPVNQNLRVNVPTNQNANILLNNTLQLGQRLGQQQLANQIYTAMRSNDKRTLSNIVNRYSRSCPQLAQQANAFLQLNVYG